MDAISKLDCANEITKPEAGTGIDGIDFFSTRVSLMDIARETKYTPKEVASLLIMLMKQGLVFRGADWYPENSYDDQVVQTFTLRPDREVTNN